MAISDRPIEETCHDPRSRHRAEKALVQSTLHSGATGDRVRRSARVVVPGIRYQRLVHALGDGFIKLIRMAIAPIIFCTVVSGIAHISQVSKVGRVAIKALVYFEVVSTFALIIGLVIANLLQPGAGFTGQGNAAAVAGFAKQANEMKPVDFVLHIIPDSAVGGFAAGDILQVLLFSVLFGFALMALGERGQKLREIIDEAAHTMFGIIAIVVKAAPIGAFGAMAYTIGRYGPQTLGNLAGLVGTFYLTSALFVFVVLGAIAWMVGFSIFKYIALHQGRASDRARYQLVGERAAAAHGEAGATRLFETGGRPRCADRLFVQSRWHQHLYDAYHLIHRAGAERAAIAWRAANHSDSRNAHL